MGVILHRGFPEAGALISLKTNRYSILQKVMSSLPIDIAYGKIVDSQDGYYSVQSLNSRFQRRHRLPPIRDILKIRSDVWTQATFRTSSKTKWQNISRHFGGKKIGIANTGIIYKTRPKNIALAVEAGEALFL